MAQTGTIPYIGCRISLISKSGIRYEGFLFNIDTKESTVALQNVRSFGTEGRRKDGQDIPPSNNLYDYIIFRGSDIQDLKVCEAPPAVSMPQPPPHDPAIINMGQQMGQHPMYAGGYPPQMHYPYPPYYNVPYPVGAGYRGMVQQRPSNLPPQQLHPNPSPPTHPQHAHQGQNRRAVQTPTGHHKEEPSDDIPNITGDHEDDIKDEPKELDTGHNEESISNNSNEKSDLPEQETSEKTTTEDTESSDAPVDAPPKEHTVHQSLTATPGLTGWADAARGAKHKPAHHGNVQYSHARAGQAGERRAAATARKQPQLHQHRNPPSAPRHRVAPVPMTEFDFEKANSLFDKAKIKQELLKGVEETQSTEQGSAVSTPQPAKAYDKATSFFDSLSCDSLSEDDGSKRSSYAEQRRLNAETFGVQSISEGRSHHRPQNDRGNRQYQRRANGASGHGSYSGNRSQNTKRVFVPVPQKSEGTGKK